MTKRRFNYDTMIAIGEFDERHFLEFLDSDIILLGDNQNDRPSTLLICNFS